MREGGHEGCHEGGHEGGREAGRQGGRGPPPSRRRTEAEAGGRLRDDGADLRHARPALQQGGTGAT